MQKKGFVIILSLMLLMGLLAGCSKKTVETAASPSASPSAAAPTAVNAAKEIRIGYQASSSLTVLAKVKGYYEEEFGKDGTKVTYSLFTAGPPMVEALSGDRLDIANMGPLPAISARSNGIDVKAVGRSYSDDYYYALLVRPDSSFSSVKDLKGKKVAVQVGSGAHLFFMQLLQQNGLKNSDVNLVNLPTADQATALKTGNVDAVATWQPFVATIELSKDGKVLVDSKNVIKTVGVYLARNDFGLKNSNLVERFLKVHQKAAEYLRNNPDEAADLISKESKLPKEAVLKSNKTIDWGLQLTDDDIKTLSDAKTFLKDTNVLKKDFDINELVEKKYLNSIGVK